MNSNRLCQLPGRWIVAAVFLSAGCGGPKFSFNEMVEGVVTLDGQPLSNVTVRFLPEAKGEARPPVSASPTDEKGRFQLKCQRNGKIDQPGAVLGKHIVQVIENRPRKRKGEAPDEEAPPPRVPAIYATLESSVNVEVTPDKHSYDIKLTSE